MTCRHQATSRWSGSPPPSSVARRRGSVRRPTSRAAESTLVNNYVAKIRRIIRAACNAAELPYTLGGRRLKVPKGVPKPKAKFLVDHAAANHLFAAAAGSGLLAETMLPLLGYLTGRRLGLLAFVRGEDIHQHDGVWMVTPRDIVRDDQGNWVTVPFKTGESLTSFVLHDLLVRIGFVDWARRQKGFIFSSLHETKDPADTASKRMCRLYDKAAIDSEMECAPGGGQNQAAVLTPCRAC